MKKNKYNFYLLAMTVLLGASSLITSCDSAKKEEKVPISGSCFYNFPGHRNNRRRPKFRNVYS